MERLRENPEADSPLRMESDAGLDARIPRHDLSQNQELAAQLAEPPRSPSI